MEIVPIKQEYIFSVMKHTMRAIAEHKEDMRYLSYYFDDRLVATKVTAGGDYYSDDECIREVVDDYKKNHKGAYADLFNNHTDIISLTAKLLEVDLINSGIVIKTKVKIVKDYYEIELATENGDDQFSGKFKAVDFSEVLEKMRLFTSTLADVGTELAQNISLLSTDKIQEVIKWQE